MRRSDPIVDEVREARDAIAKEVDYDIDKLAEMLKNRLKAKKKGGEA